MNPGRVQERSDAMHYTSAFFTVLSFLLAMAVCSFSAGNLRAEDTGKNRQELQVVEHVDLSRYLGTWYEVASIPVWFQKECAGGTTATYSLDTDGRISVLNQCCTKDRQKKQARGKAWVVDTTTNAKLKVSFFSLFGFWLFSGDYWIIDLGPNYEYAVIGHPGRSIGWILSRTPVLPDDVLRGIGERLTARGYDYSRFKKTNQADYRCTTP
jgi:apolipoprotein D and lipocalin family protein